MVARFRSEENLLRKAAAILGLSQDSQPFGEEQTLAAAMFLVAQRSRALDRRIRKCGNFAGQGSILPELGLDQFRKLINCRFRAVALARYRYRIALRGTEHHQVEYRGTGDGLAIPRHFDLCVQLANQRDELAARARMQPALIGNSDRALNPAQAA